MEALPPPPPTSDGMLFVVSTAQRELAIQKQLVGAPATRLALVKSAVGGQPIFLFDSETRKLYGPYAAEGPGAMNLDPNFRGLPAQVRFSTVARKYQPLPESAVEDLLTFDAGPDAHGRPRPSFTVDSSTVGPLLLLFVLRHHGLYDEDEEEDIEVLGAPTSAPAPRRGRPARGGVAPRGRA